MKAWSTIGDAMSRWIDSVTATTILYLERFTSPNTIRLTEDEDGEFVLQGEKILASTNAPLKSIRFIDGQIDDALLSTTTASLASNRIEILLRPDRFLFRPLELPGRAAEFLNGIVRAQIDRLTPWNVGDAAFGWSKPAESGPDRMTVTVAATSTASIKPFATAISSLGALSVAIFTHLPGSSTEVGLIKVWEERARGVLNVSRLRKSLIFTLVASGLAALAAFTSTMVIGTSLDLDQTDIARQIATVRATAGNLRDADLRSVAASRRTLDRLKHETPSTVLVLEGLSHTLPDNTYVTELRIEAGMLRLVGVTQDAPALIGLLEQSGLFTRATFFGPTTRFASNQSEQFHIEAVMQPLGQLHP